MNMLLAKTAAAPTAKNSFIFTVLGTKWGILWLWLLIINVLALVVYGVDKASAHGWAWSCSATRPSTAPSGSASLCSP